MINSQQASSRRLSECGQYQGNDNLEAPVLAARCLANLMEALPDVAHPVVYHCCNARAEHNPTWATCNDALATGVYP